MERLVRLEERIGQLEAEFQASVPNDVEQIIVKVCRKFGLPKKMLLSRKRDAGTAWARQVCMYLAVKTTSHTKHRIGSVFGRNHGTVLHSEEAVTNRMHTDKRIKAEVESLM